MFLLDTCIILELLLDQKNADDVERLLHDTPASQLHITEFSLYSLGVILLRHNKSAVFLQAKNDLLTNGGIGLIRLGPDDMEGVVEASRRFDLDFDDAYQCHAAVKHDLTLISFDAHFDRTDRGRKTPAAPHG